MFDKLKGNTPTERVAEPRAVEPPMAASSSASQSQSKSAVIGVGIRIQGDISGTENILVEGQVEGRINLDSNDVIIGKSGRVVADVTANSIRVSGEVNGDLRAKERVVISGTGNVRGNVIAPRVVLEDGAVFKGSIDMDPGETVNSKLAATATKSTTRTPEVVASAAKPATGSAGLDAAAKDAGSKSPDLALKGS
jgi:cytoskeletal protein CcmA (bactofilin family)